jgi:hypothetical protein
MSGHCLIKYRTNVHYDLLSSQPVTLHAPVFAGHGSIARYNQRQPVTEEATSLRSLRDFGVQDA